MHLQQREEFSPFKMPGPESLNEARLPDLTATSHPHSAKQRKTEIKREPSHSISLAVTALVIPTFGKKLGAGAAGLD